MYSLLYFLAITFTHLPLNSVSALRESSPLVAWSPNSRPLSGLITQGVTPNEWPIYNENSKGDTPCNFDVVAFISHPGLGVNDLRRIDKSSSLHKRFVSSAQNVSFTDIPTSTLPSMSEAAESLANRCDAEFMEFAAERGIQEIVSSKKVVVHAILSPLTGFGRWRKEAMSDHIAALNSLFESIEELSSNHAIIYSSSPLPHHAKRQSQPVESLPEPFSFAPAKRDATGIFSRYQLFTPGLLTGLLAVLFIILPLLVFSIQALASIQSSVRLDTPKVVSQERKAQ